MWEASLNQIRTNWLGIYNQQTFPLAQFGKTEDSVCPFPSQGCTKS